MQTDELFKQTSPPLGGFCFDENVARVFDDMIYRSIPLYADVQRAICLLAESVNHDPLRIVDLGCSTGTSLNFLADCLKHRRLQLIGVDNSQAMLDRCQQKLDGIDFDGECRLILTDILEYQLEAASMVLMNYTLQFLPPNCRLSMLERVYLGLERDGLIVLSEKVAHPDRETDRALTELYFQFKRDNGYSDLEIARKRDSLENVLVPLTVGENIELLEQAGFRNVEILLKWFNFATFVAAK